ncbi:gephyrin-like molybdotransferase Glp [Cognatishimia sp.]|uniref:molybdopterin-binding protein n=1 Tax=Cognatishimia sp. TaxID=2211648 RepID=UPI0035147EAE
MTQPPPLKNDCFALPPGVEWTPVDEALDLLNERLTSVTGQEVISPMAALGRVLAAPVTAARAHPPHANCAVDGYALTGAAFGEGVHEVPLVTGRSAAGQPFAGRVPDTHAVRVLTGANLPDGTDTVILQEDVSLQDGKVAFHGPLKTGSNARKRGEDVSEGTALFPSGHRLTPADLGLLAATGVSEVSVRKPLRVAVISTGDELAEVGSAASPDQIYDANRPMLLAAIQQLGYVPIDMGRIPDQRALLTQALQEAASKADVILTSGGASAGDEDHMSALLNETGTMALWRIAIKPGRPLALGMWDGTPVFGLPGNPVAAMVCTLVFARPVMRVLAGQSWALPAGTMLPAAFHKSKKAGRREYLRARVRNGAVEVFASEGSGRISGLSWAEGLVELSDAAQEITPGTPVKFVSYSDFGL